MDKRSKHVTTFPKKYYEIIMEPTNGSQPRKRSTETRSYENYPKKIK